VIGRLLALAVAAGLLGLVAADAAPFEGRIEVMVTRNGEPTALLYTLQPGALRIEILSATKPEPVNIVDLKTGALTLVLPHNRSFVVVKGGRGEARLPPMPLRPASVAGAPPMPPIPAVPAAPGGRLELKPTGKREKILGFDCAQFELSERGERVEVWATDALGPFREYVRQGGPHFGPRQLEEQWAEQMAANKLFPLRASLHDETSTVRFKFEVRSITPAKLTEEHQKLFHPPEGYAESPPLPL